MDSLINRGDLKTLVKLEIKKFMSSMDLDKDNKLPSEDNLARMIGVSRVTIRAALDDLSAEGVIFRRQGKGTFVNRSSRDIKVSFNPVMNIMDMITNSGYQPGIRLLDHRQVPADEEVAKALALEPGQSVVESRKLYFADDKLCAYCVDFFETALVDPACLEALGDYEHPIFHFLYKMAGVQVEWDMVEISTTDSVRTPELQRYAQLPDGQVKSFLLLRGINHDPGDRPVLYAKEYIDTDIIRFSQIRWRSLQYETGNRER